MRARLLKIADQSPDPSTKVGALLVSAGKEFAGWNKFPLGITDYYWEKRELKYGAVVHAEVAAILQAGPRECKNATLYVSHHPCRDCAKVIAFSGISCVVCPPGPWRDDQEVMKTVMDAKLTLHHCGVKMETLI